MRMFVDSTMQAYNNQLRSLPVAIGELTRLADLALHDNQLQSLPGALGRLTNLQALNVCAASVLFQLTLFLLQRSLTIS